MHANNGVLQYDLYPIIIVAKMLIARRLRRPLRNRCGLGNHRRELHNVNRRLYSRRSHLVAPCEQLLRSQSMAPRNLRDYDARRKTFSDNLRLEVIRPLPPPPDICDDLQPLKVAALMVNCKVNLMVKSISFHHDPVSSSPPENGRWDCRSAYVLQY